MTRWITWWVAVVALACIGCGSEGDEEPMASYPQLSVFDPSTTTSPCSNPDHESDWVCISNVPTTWRLETGVASEHLVYVEAKRRINLSSQVQHYEQFSVNPFRTSLAIGPDNEEFWLEQQRHIERGGFGASVLVSEGQVVAVRMAHTGEWVPEFVTLLGASPEAS